jgi:broad specificity phosphatase PhoE
VSAFLRATATAEPILVRWPLTRCETWPIQELTYLSPARCRGTTAETRRPWVEEYWLRCDPDYRDGPDAESFRTFMARLRDFHRRLLTLVGDFVVVVGHGQFFRAYMLGQREGFAVTAEWMRGYRTAETARPMANCEIIELTSEALARCRV